MTSRTQHGELSSSPLGSTFKEFQRAYFYASQLTDYEPKEFNRPKVEPSGIQAKLVKQLERSWTKQNEKNEELEFQHFHSVLKIGNNTSTFNYDHVIHSSFPVYHRRTQNDRVKKKMHTETNDKRKD